MIHPNMQAEGQSEEDTRREAWRKYVLAWGGWVAAYTSLAVMPFFKAIVVTRAPSLPACTRMLTVLRLAVAYGFVELQARRPNRLLPGWWGHVLERD